MVEAEVVVVELEALVVVELEALGVELEVLGLVVVVHSDGQHFVL